MAPDAPPTIQLSAAQWQAFLAGLYERDDRLDLRQPGVAYAPDEAVDAYALSAHAEALRSEEIDGDLWGTLEDLELSAPDEDVAWAQIKAFYLERDCVLVNMEPGDEWIFSAALARRLKLA